jgi:type VI secretion system protein ImpA
MQRAIDLAALLAPLPGDNPAGEDMRYQPLYDAIKEARRADDLLDRGDWGRELKTADWDTVITLATEALSRKTKDLMIAAWLMEALLTTEGFAGAAVGLTLLEGLLRDFWDHVYPLAEDGDLDYRCGPLEFVNDKLTLLIRTVPLTDSRMGPGYSWLQWQESVKVGKETDILNQWGDVDDTKKQARDQLIADGKLTGEAFEAAVQVSGRAFYEELMQLIQSCLDIFLRLDALVDEKFGNEAPRLSDFRTALEDCEAQVGKILKEKRRLEPDPELDTKPESTGEGAPPAAASPHPQPQAPVRPQAGVAMVMPAATLTSASAGVNRLLGSGGLEELRWQQAQATLQSAGIETAVEELLGAACSAQSTRERANYHLLIARLCLQVKRADLARPLVEQLFAQMEELQLARWESPIWIAEVLDSLYRCLTDETATDEDRFRAREILNRLCTTDITKAMQYRL